MVHAFFLNKSLTKIFYFLLIIAIFLKIVLQAVFVTSKLSVMSGSDVPLFKRFKNNWVNLDLRNFHT